ncbi:unnamed protein product, partial [Adineta steineri]
MSATNNKAKEKSRQHETIHQAVNQQTTALTSLILNTSQQDMADVIHVNHFPCSFAHDLTFYQYDAIVEEYHEKQNKYINLSSREKRHQFVSNILLAKEIHPTAICWYDEGSCLYSTTNFEDKLPVVYEKEDQGYRRRLTIKSLTATSGTN